MDVDRKFYFSSGGKQVKTTLSAFKRGQTLILEVLIVEMRLLCLPTNEKSRVEICFVLHRQPRVHSLAATARST